ncbi:MAG TPA: TIR domain-containing protein [Cyclobacteriaceae bacterium]|nr:TIR domain-containing protein [Cyclobacteriaceae bacterium]HMV09414.1 TIR domain-containing protein [Cyclobacteriaceae bacterium]HMX02435.1 TIR domain-containing protein [Cyclobacteriaceae bacterium]HMX51077.1 TIR domain-containing protein [Cyclobacteriaceae bacterium]HMY91739.1 TIR domain-containing protein [Cyclobacteriaceae bacterium]
MGKKIFVSYKYLDSLVQDLNIYEDVRDFWGNLVKRKVTTTARHYVDKIDELLEVDDHIFKGEDDGEDMRTLEDATIGSKLGDKIFDSSVTIVLVSKGMKEPYTAEKDQWIPWEISYSLKEQSREEGRSKTNSVLAVVLPDTLGRYDYYIVEDSCPYCKCRILKTDFLFQILRDNMFNIKRPVFTNCENHVGSRPYQGYSSFIYSVKWTDFIAKPSSYINIAVAIRQNIDDYEITKTVK